MGQFSARLSLRFRTPGVRPHRIDELCPAIAAWALIAGGSSLRRLCLQPELDQAADGFGAGDILLVSPNVESVEHLSGQSHEDAGINTARLGRATAFFLDIRY